MAKVVTMRSENIPDAPDYYLQSFEDNLVFTLDQDKAWLLADDINPLDIITTVKSMFANDSLRKLIVNVKPYTGDSSRL